MTMEQVAQDSDELHWYKSSHSGSDGGNCVEVAADTDTVYVRDSKAAANGPVLRVRREKWSVFVSHGVS